MDRWGLTLPLPGLALPEHRTVAEAAESAGFTDLWSGETQGPDGFTPLALAAGWTERARLGTGVVNVFTRGPAVLAQHAAALQDASGGRFCLGIGSSSDVIVERWNGGQFDRPLTRVRETLDFLRQALAGEKARVEGETLDAGPFRLEQAPAEPVPIVLAALRGKMLRLAAAEADGAFVNFMPLQALPGVRSELEAGAREAGRDPASLDVLCRFFLIPGDPKTARAVAAFTFAAYATVPVYERFFRWLGYGDAIDPLVESWRAGDRKGALGKVPHELLDDIFVFGEPEQMRDRVRQFVDGGITTPVLTPIVTDAGAGAGDPGRIAELVSALGP